MKKIVAFLMLNLSFLAFALADAEPIYNKLEGTNQNMSNIWADGRLENITRYGSLDGLENLSGFGALWTYLQGNHYFSYGVALAVIGVIFAFGLHYMVIGPRHFRHNGQKIYAFSLFNRVVHLFAAISWVILVPTGIAMMWGEALGGGFFVRVLKNLHGIATIIFALAVLPMLFMWLKRMLPALYDIKWMMIMGGYLSKVNRPIPAGKFNAGQKMWFWIATVGGLIMIATGGAMYFLDFKTPVLGDIFTQIEILRLSAIIHNTLGIVCAVFLLVHLYMSVFAVKGAIHAMITGYSEEEEIYILHHYWYQELEKDKIVSPSRYEPEYGRL